MSTSDRRSGSSGASKKRRSVYVSSAQHGRAGQGARRAGGQAPTGTRASRAVDPHADSPARREAEARRIERERRAAAARRAARLRVAAVIAVAAAVIGLCVTVYRSPLFAIGRVEVVGARNLSSARVRALAAVPPDATLIRFPADAVAARVASDPWVAEVSVSRLFPDGMRIRVTERVPLALVDAGSVFWLADGNGYIIAQRTAESTATLPVVRDVPGLDLRAGRRTTSEPLLNALKVLGGISSALRSQVRLITAPSIDGTTLLTRDRVEIVFGEASDVALKDERARMILDEQRGRVVSIDVRTVDRPTWRGLK